MLIFDVTCQGCSEVISHRYDPVLITLASPNADKATDYITGAKV